jgi:hypothetical protein
VVAQVHAHRGDVEAAFEWLGRLETEGRQHLLEHFQEPLFDSLREDARWRNLLAGIGVAPEQLASIEFSVNPSMVLAAAR